MTMLRAGAGGVAVLAAAVTFAWAVVAFGPGVADRGVTALIGATAAATDYPLVETLFTVLVYGALIAIAAAAGAVERRNVAALGAAPVSRLGIGLIAGVAGLTVSMLYARLAGTLVPGATAGGAGATMLAWGAGVVAFQTVAEEVYFRGWLQPALAARWGTPVALVAAALAFAGLHVFGGVRAPVSLLNLFVGGLVFGWFAAEARGLAGAIGVHFAWNASEQLIYGLDPNPGIGSFGAIVDRDLAGAAWWGGSGEGLNGSIGMTLALLAILAPLAMLTWRRVTAGARETVAREAVGRGTVARATAGTGR